MPTLASIRPDDDLFGAADWTSLGLVLCIVGAFLIANSTLFEHPRSAYGIRLMKPHTPRLGWKYTSPA